MLYISVFFQEVLQIDTGYFIYQGKFIRQVPLHFYSPWGAFAEETNTIRSLVNGLTLETLSSQPSEKRWISREHWSHKKLMCIPQGIEDVSF